MNQGEASETCLLMQGDTRDPGSDGSSPEERAAHFRVLACYGRRGLWELSMSASGEVTWCTDGSNPAAPCPVRPLSGLDPDARQRESSHSFFSAFSQFLVIGEA